MNITLLITEQCNLNCQYCYCRKDSLKRMSFDIAKNIIDSTCEKLDFETERLNVLLMGGEPLLEFDLIKKVYSYLSEKIPLGRFNCKTVSNGTLLTQEIKEWLMENRIQITISLDGVDCDHNKFRSESFESIDLDFFKGLNSCTEVNMTIMPETLNNMAYNVIFLEKLGFRVKTTLAEGVDWSEEQNERILVEQLKVLMEHYYTNKSLDPCSILAVATSVVGGEELNTCQAGITSKSYDTLGKEYACHRCTDLYNKGEWFIPLEKMNLKNIGVFYEDCEDCIAKNICNTCPASIASLQVNTEAIKAKCKLQKAIIYSNAIFHSNLLVNYPEHLFLKKFNGLELKSIIEGCKRIIEELN
ncbi:radical SAM protein [Marinifilum fragile]|uniref:radical SAM protein n=1 Tax=Marinifilum fragile TaxID=570161 RepID=UPI002AA8CFAF|nr:radical SAM protein [Marinifilum fragile]